MFGGRRAAGGFASTFSGGRGAIAGCPVTGRPVAGSHSDAHAGASHECQRGAERRSGTREPASRPLRGDPYGQAECDCPVD